MTPIELLMESYNALQKQIYCKDNYSIVPIREADKYLIMEWRNEQMYHLRQSNLLTATDQDSYFKNVLKPSFKEKQPKQILFSYLENGKCIGYGGLVHMNWVDKHAEISFIINPKLEPDYFIHHWYTYLNLIEQVAFNELNLHKIFTYAFDLRPKLYEVLENSGFTKEAVLKDHSLWENGFVDVIIHRKINPFISIRKAEERDKQLYFIWANDPVVRQQSFNSASISKDAHYKWFDAKLKDENTYLYVFENHLGIPVGQVRLQRNKELDKAVIGVSVDKNFRGKGLASKMLERAVAEFLKTNNGTTIEAYIKMENIKSVNAFIKAHFRFEKELPYEGFESVLLLY